MTSARYLSHDVLLSEDGQLFVLLEAVLAALSLLLRACLPLSPPPCAAGFLVRLELVTLACAPCELSH